MRRLVLLGGGHAHLSVLKLLAQRLKRSYEVIMITPDAHQNYSGMLPGWMAGHYSKTQVQIDLNPLLHAADVKFIPARTIAIDATRRRLVLQNQKQIDYDLLSVDVGSEINAEWLELAGDKLLPVKPLDRFFEAWPKVLTEARQTVDYRLAVVGGGAAGIELALAAHYAFLRNAIDAKVHLVISDSGLLGDHSISVQNRMKVFLQKSGVIVHAKKAVGSEHGLMFPDGTTLLVNRVIAATGARAPIWLQGSGLALDTKGYILVDHFHRSVSHPEVFAAGDVCSRQDVLMARSGVHAVHAGPILGRNLDASMKGESLTAYKPRAQSLYLLACGKRYALASWGRFSTEGRWVWYWKDWIDRRFMQKFSQHSLAIKGQK